MFNPIFNISFQCVGAFIDVIKKMFFLTNEVTDFVKLYGFFRTYIGKISQQKTKYKPVICSLEDFNILG